MNFGSTVPRLRLSFELATRNPQPATRYSLLAVSSDFRRRVQREAGFFSVAGGSSVGSTSSGSSSGSVASLPGGVEGGALIVRSGFAHDESSGRRFVATDTFLLLRVHEGWDGANGGGRFYVRNQVEKRVEVRQDDVPHRGAS